MHKAKSYTKQGDASALVTKDSDTSVQHTNNVDYAQPVQKLQSVIGNRALLKVMKAQAKLSVSEPGDQYEQEADRVADQVMRMPDNLVTQSLLSEKGQTPAIQRMKPCPQHLNEDDPTPKGFKPYYGGSSWFHCGYRTILEDRIPTTSDPINECVYDKLGNLVTPGHRNEKCGGTPDYYDSETEKYKHTVEDPGGIVHKGWDAFKESRKYWFEDSEIRDTISGASASDLAGIPLNTRINMVNRLLSGWISDADIATIGSIFRNAPADQRVKLKTVIESQLQSMTDIGQRTQMRVILAGH